MPNYKPADVDVYVEECINLWNELEQYSYGNEAKLDACTESVLGPAFASNFAGVSYAFGLTDCVKKGLLDVNELKQIKRNLVRLEQELGQHAFHEAVQKLVKEHESKKIAYFGHLRAKVLIEAMDYDLKIADKIRFMENIKELKEAFGIKTVLKEAYPESDDVESLDKVQLFSDLADIEANLSSSLSMLYQYKFQYVENPTLQKQLSDSRVAISAALDKVNSILIGLGTQGERME